LPSRAVAVVICVLLSACIAGGDEPQAGPDRPTTEASQTPPSEDAPASCKAVQSAARYAEQIMVPYGKEQRQRYEGALRGRMVYVAGTIERVMDDLPDATVGKARAVQRTAMRAGAIAAIRDPNSATLLYRYRTATRRFLVACGLEAE
jgi:hypothetical protein